MVLLNEDSPIALGFTRLAIRALATGAQPFHFNNGTSVINGELYNQDDISSKLMGGTKPEGDMQVLGQFLGEFGIESIVHADGMFAGFLINHENNELHLFRDKVGEKPLYYRLTENHIEVMSENTFEQYFVSDQKNDVTRALFGFLPEDASEVKGIKRVAPGSFITFDLSSLNFCEKKYWEWPSRPTNRRGRVVPHSMTFKENLYKSVESRLAADVPIASFLSGGIDSVITTYILSKINPNIEAFVVSMGDGDTKNDDIKYARIAAKEFGVKLHEIILTEDDVINAIPETLYVIEQARWQNLGSAIAQIALGKKINELGFKVVFSGDLSDEIWGSYGHIQAFHYKPEDYDKARRKLVEDVHKTNFLTTNQSIMWGGTVEVRTPYSWRPFVEYTLNIPPLYQKENGHMKPLLRAAFKGEISDELLFRPKVFFAKGARTGELIESRKQTLKSQLNSVYLYKDTLNLNKFFEYA
jgi:asparagine synthase (glutamine-hydrolysing)